MFFPLKEPGNRNSRHGQPNLPAGHRIHQHQPQTKHAPSPPPAQVPQNLQVSIAQLKNKNHLSQNQD